MQPEPQHLPQGALRQADGTVQWRIWAPFSKDVQLVTWPAEESVSRPGAGRREIAMSRHQHGYFVHGESEVGEGLRYAYRLDDGPEIPDPASRSQPEGVHKPSAVFFPERFAWSDEAWRGITKSRLAVYELHVGAFTSAGTFEAARARLSELVDLGVTAIELMPVGQFPGKRSWGYDGVQLYAVQNSYGGPRGLQELVDAAHQIGLAVILDVVYNHLGPEGNYLGQFGPYFTDRYGTPWGAAVNFDGPDSDPVRQFVIDNARMWVRDFHVDGLRLDAVHAIFDFGARHILADIQQAVQDEAASLGRIVHVIAESDQNDVRLVTSPERGGYGLDGVWSDDFHHSVHALLTGERDGYYEDFGRPEHLAKAYNDVFVYDGSYSPFRRRRHGSRVGDLPRDRFVVCVQNHDQIGNRALGDRFGTLLSPSAQRLACGLLMLSPCVPLLFMGQEYGETHPFPFFCSFGDSELIEAVRRGRREEFQGLAFEWDREPPDPQNPATFESVKLSWNWPEGSIRAGLRRLHQDLLSARRRWPALEDRESTVARLFSAVNRTQVDAPALLLLERGTADGLLACANLAGETQLRPRLALGTRQLLLSTEWTHYGGPRESGPESNDLLPYELVIYGPIDWRQ